MQLVKITIKDISSVAYCVLIPRVSFSHNCYIEKRYFSIDTLKSTNPLHYSPTINMKRSNVIHIYPPLCVLCF